MFEHNMNHKDIFDEGYKSLQKGILLFGGSLVMLAILIFLFPALIGFIFAAFILLAGTAILAVGWKVWRFKKHLGSSEEWSKPVTASFRTEGPHYTKRRIIVVMK
ncbi:MAG: hypothetical protein OEZ51_01660 [Nitrospinota bacterium]|nr:hypothetical protein [Nitrospinota bacterium]